MNTQAWHDEYAKYGLVTFPCNGKTPCVKWQSAWMRPGIKWNSSGGNIAMRTGEGVTVVDVDDYQKANMCREMFGETPIEVKTRRGVHFWYASSGERNAQGVLPDVDVRGIGGYAIVPISEGYTFLQGHLSEIPNLPTIPPGILPERTKREMKEGDGRNRRLFSELKECAAKIESLDELMEKATRISSEFAEPLPNAEVVKIAGSVWKYKAEGRLIYKGEKKLVIPDSLRSDMMTDADSQAAFLLLLELQSAHGWRNGTEIVLSNNTRNLLNMPLRRFQAALGILEDRGLLKITDHGGRGPGSVRKARLIT